ncbi:MAG: patatin-like phospholipase family protein [Methylococcaceae bacterium]
MNDNTETQSNKTAVRLEWGEAFEKEFMHIRAHRESVYSPDDTNQALDNLVGLAFSGGGIRSATFGLGVLEVLKEFDLLKKIDYLSTVSGGGYIGAWLSANCKRTAEHNEKAKQKKQPAEPDWLCRNSDWKTSIDHLRRYSNYLSPKFSVLSADTWSIGTIWLRNTLLVQLMVILAIAVLLLLPRPLFVAFEQWSDASSIHWATIFLYILAVVGIAGNLLRLNRPKSRFLNVKNWWRGLVVALISLLVAWGIGDYVDYDLFAPEAVNPYIASIIAILLVIAGFFLQPVAVQLVNIFWQGDNAPKEINYTQTYVQTVVVLPMMVVGFFDAIILKGQIMYDVIHKSCDKTQDAACAFAQLDTFGGLFTSAWNQWPFTLSVVFMSLWLLSFCSVRTYHIKGIQTYRVKDLFFALLAPVPAMVVLHALLSVIMVLLHDWKPDVAGQAGQWYTFVWIPTLILFAFSLTVVMLIGMLGRQSSEDTREWWSRFAAWLAIYGFSWMVIVVIAVYSPLWSAMLWYGDYWKELGTGWIGTTLAGLFAGKSADTGGTDSKGISTKLKELVAKVAPFIFIAGLLIAISMALHLVIAINSAPETNPPFKISQLTLLGNTGQSDKQLDLQIDAKSDVKINVSAVHASIREPASEDTTPIENAHWKLLTHANSKVTWIIIAGGIFCILLLAWRVDINEFSLNAFYRNRLVRCYLGAARFRPGQRKPQNFTGFDDADDLALAALVDGDHKQAPKGPLHIVNCALNLGGSTDLALHTRHSAIFTLNPLFCGSRYLKRDQAGNTQEIGYASTALFGGSDDQPSLGQAISVSGAAASPNMGYHTSSAVAFLMTLFNARLGWWFPNPCKSNCQQPSPTFSLWYLLKELFGLANEKSRFLAISDGGHFENLAAYELIKRQCKVIIISDGECDPKLQFEGLATLIRMCEVDDLVEKIEIDVRSIHPESDSDWSRSRCAVGEITYKDDSKGRLIYLKASMNGHEDTAVMQYKSVHPDFPHETTGDQFYGEDQFESYRSLGRDITEQLFGKITIGDLSMDKIAKELSTIFSPMLSSQMQFTKHADRLMNIWNQLSKRASLKPLDDELRPSTAPERAVFYLCSEMIQLMENVYLDLNLEDTWDDDDNKGWMELYKQWAKSSNLIATWDLTKATYSERFQSFWDRKLI